MLSLHRIESPRTVALYAIIAISLLLFTGCIRTNVYQQIEYHNYQDAKSADGCRIAEEGNSCLPVNGRVLGEIIPGSNIDLYKLDNLNFTYTLEYIRFHRPVQRAVVNTTKGFRFNCLTDGKYAAVIPTTSFIRTVGSPLPYEFEKDDFSLHIVSQGGDYQYAVGKFEIFRKSATIPKALPALGNYRLICI